MCKYVKFRWLTGMIIFVICVACLIGFSMEADEQLNQRLGEIRGQKREIGKWTDWEKLEAQCLELVKDHNSPAGKGEIYATIAFIYSEAGWYSSEDVRIPKALKYCKKALEYPLETIAACRMYGGWTDCLMVEYWKHTEDELVKIRQEAIVPCLTGLKLVLDNNAPEKLPPPSVVGKYNVDPDRPDYEKLMKKHQEELAAHKKWQFLKELYFQRKAFTQRCVTLYSHKPYATDELKLTAEKILRGHEDVAKGLIAEVETEIARIEKGSVPVQDDK
jgi:hypothetical protein